MAKYFRGESAEASQWMNKLISFIWLILSLIVFIPAVIITALIIPIIAIPVVIIDFIVGGFHDE